MLLHPTLQPIQRISAFRHIVFKSRIAELAAIFILLPFNSERDESDITQELIKQGSETMRTKTLQQLTLQELASIHLDQYGHPCQLADGWIQSGMGFLVTEIQQSLPRVYTGFFSPLYGAFALLDQIGEIYKNTAMADCGNDAASGIKKALYYFGGMPFDSDEVKALYGLRNALMHNGSLLYRGRFDKKTNAWDGPFHRFRWNKSLEGPVKLPGSPWDGVLDNLTPRCTTEINVAKICELAIASVGAAKRALENNALGISLKEGEQELYYRYLHHERPRPSQEDESAN